MENEEVSAIIESVKKTENDKRMVKEETMRENEDGGSKLISPYYVRDSTWYMYLSLAR